MDTTMDYSDLTAEELQFFHSIDRHLYGRLVINLRFEMMQALYLIALWLWLEELGYPNLVLKMLTLPDGVVQTLAHEAVRCIQCLYSDTPPSELLSPVVTEIPITQELMEKKAISLSILYKDRLDGLSTMTETVVQVGDRAFDDITNEAVLLANANNNHGNHNQHDQQEGVINQGTGNQPADFRPVTSTSTSTNTGSGSANVGHMSQPHGVVGPSAADENHEVPPVNRTMFITFSRGYLVTERELKDFFVRNYGECIEALHMQQVRPYRQPLCALVVFKSLRTIENILDGREKAKFTINGKHVWAKLHVEKQHNSAVPAATSASKAS